MLSVTRRPMRLLAPMLFLFVAAGPVAAGDPPAGVVLDAAVTVTVTAPADGGASTVVAGATVSLWAYVSDFPDEPIQELTALTDDAGIAAFAGVARSDAGGPVVHLGAEALLERITPDDECLTAESWYGVVSDVPSSDGLDIPVLANPSSSIICPPPVEEELPSGLVADAGLELAVSLDGSPVDASVFAFVAWNGWSTVIETAAVGGSAVIEGLPRPEDPSEPVDVILSAISQVDDAVMGCDFTRTAEGGATLALTESGVVESAIELAVEPFEPPTIATGLRIVDRDGGRVGGSSVFVVQTHPDDAAEPWSCHTMADEDGDATVPLYDWGSPESPSEWSVEVHGPVTSSEVRGDCVLSFGPYGQTSGLQQDDPLEERADVVTDVVELDAVCSTTGTPPPGGVGGGAGPTLPPTDAAAGVARSGATPLPAVVAILLAVAASTLATTIARPHRRRR